MVFSRWNKVWVVISICSLLTYALNSLYNSLEFLYRFFLNDISIQFLLSAYFIFDVLVTDIGVAFRVVGGFIALASAYLAWGPKLRSFLSVKKKIAVALLFEGIYFLSLLPITIYYLTTGLFLTFFLGYLLEIVVVLPFLFVLSFKFWRYEESAGTNLLKWISLAAIGYLVHIWINHVFRWLSMVWESGISFLLEGIIMVGFLNSIVTLSLSLISAIVGFYFLLNKGDRNFATKLFGISLILLGLHFAIFIVYSVIAGSSVSFILLSEIWPVTLLGLGLSMLGGR